jgi:hypothetical protein
LSRPQPPGRRDTEKLASSAQALAAQLAQRRAQLAEIADARDAWEAHHAGPQEQAREAVAELDRRGIQHEDPEPQAEPEAEPEQPQPNPRAAELDQHVEQAREAVIRIAVEREHTRQAEAERIDLEQSTSRAQSGPGREAQA